MHLEYFSSHGNSIMQRYWGAFAFSIIVLLTFLAASKDYMEFGNLMESQSSPQDVQLWSTNSDVRSYQQLYARWRNVCETTNKIRARTDKLSVTADFPEERPWSLTAKSFQQQKGYKTCKTLDSLLQAVKEGKRVWDGKQPQEPKTHEDSMHYEALPSYFLPKGCSIDYLNVQEACRILNKFSHVIIMGDSFQRHTAQGLLMMLTEDLVLGAYPRAGNKDDYLLDNCRCDGQFSGCIPCKKYEISRLLPENPRDHGICTQIPGSSFKSYYVQSGDSKVLDNLCNNDTRPILLALNGGAHYRMDGETTIQKWIDVIMRKIQTKRKACRFDADIKLIWAGVSAQSRQMDSRYPHQTRENALNFNELVDHYVSSKYKMVPVNLWNLSKDALSSDGFHYVSEVNIYKANLLLHIARFLAKETLVTLP